MRIGPAVHGALLIAALLFAYKTWTRDTTEKPSNGEIVVWSEAAGSFEGLTFISPTKEVVVTTRSDATGNYLWGKVTRKPAPPKPRGPAGIPGHGNPHGSPHGGAPDPHGGHGGHGGAPPPAAPKNDAKAPVKPGANGPAKPSAKTPAKPAAKTDGKKADQNDPILLAQASPVKPKPAAGKPPKATTPAKPKAKPAKPGATKPAAGAPVAAPVAPTPMPPAPAKPKITVREFPLGDTGDELAENFTQLRAIRELGAPTEDEKAEFGFEDKDERITLKFKGGKERSLLLGDRVFGGSDRYVLDETSGQGYVISSKVMKNIESAETSLGLKNYNKFDSAKDLEKIALSADGKTKSLVRLAVADPEAKDKKDRRTWALSTSPNIEDVSMANFIDRASKLRPMEYLPELKADALNLLLRFDYHNAADKKIGFMEFYKGKDPSKDAPEEEFYMRTERTRVLGKVNKLTAERLGQDVIEVFAITEAPDEEPAKTNDEAGQPNSPEPSQNGGSAPKSPAKSAEPAPQPTP